MTPTPPLPVEQTNQIRKVLTNRMSLLQVEDHHINGLSQGDEVRLEHYVDEIMQLFAAQATAAQERAVEQADIRGEIKGKRLALEKMRMGAGEFHDDPYEYVVPLQHIKQYEAELAVFDLDDPNPIFRDKGLAAQSKEPGGTEL